MSSYPTRPRSAKKRTTQIGCRSRRSTTFFLAGDRLQKNPLDADGLEQLLSATDVADPDRPPYGVDKRLWVRMCELADELAAALVDGDEPDVVETQAVAGELHDLLRPYV